MEAPDVFQKSETGLWDGRPSLGGIWVAHPDVKDPERVLIRNEANGKTIIGALFRREHHNPGPRFQVSSDAAAGLGMLAGAPVELSVTALRRKEPPKPEEQPAPEAPPAAEAEPPKEAPVAASAPASGGDSAISRAAAAIDRAEAEAEAEADAPAAEGEDLTEAEPLPEPNSERPRRGFLAALFGPRAPSAALSTAAAAADGTALATEAVEVVALDAPVAVATAPAPAQDAATAPLRQQRSLFGQARPSAPLDAIGIADGYAAAAAPARVTQAAATLEADSLPGATPNPTLTKAYVQVGIFADEAGAKAASAILREDGILPLILEQRADSINGWRVVVGPASTRSERTRLARQVRRLGFDDAVAVSG